jgi:succinate dehydrogenase / fumarate reductase cytochrome b subunit
VSTGSRPIDFGLTHLRLPLPGWVSILHRISGVLLLLALPLGVWALSTSLSNEEGFRAMCECVQHPLAKLLAVALAWGFAHHFFAGLRHLVMDAHIGTDLKTARASSVVVLLLSGLATLGFAGWLFT